MGYSEEAEHEHRDADDEHSQTIEPEIPTDIPRSQVSGSGAEEVDDETRRGRRAKAYYGRHGLRTGPYSPLLTAAGDDSRKAQAAPAK